MGSENKPEPLQTVHWTQLLDHRESAQLQHAIHYADHFAAAGAPGHSQFMLIAKMAHILSATLPGAWSGANK